LPPGVEQRLLEVAAGHALLLFGELHGTREVPGIVATLLPRLRAVGYGGLALEVPRVDREELTAWAEGQRVRPPAFFAQPSRDGRGNAQVLELIKVAAAHQFKLLCFDQGPDQPGQQWSDRDRWMATNLLEQWASVCDGARVVGICGSLHARLAPEHGMGRLVRKAVSGGDELWPSLAGWVRQFQPALSVAAVDVRFAAGGFFNMGERTIYPRPGAPAEPWLRGGQPRYTLELWLPRATPATFLAPPS
jgi:hypothetical protein